MDNNPKLTNPLFLRRKIRLSSTSFLLVSVAFLGLLIPGLVQADHPLAGTESLGDRDEIVTLSTRGGQIAADLFDFEAGTSTLLGTLPLPAGDLAGMQMLDAACGNMYGDQRENIVIAYSQDFDSTYERQLVLVVPTLEDGILDWNPDLSPPLVVPDFVLKFPETVYYQYHPVSVGCLRVVCGNFVAEEAGQPVRKEVMVVGWCVTDQAYVQLQARIYSVDDDRNLHEVSTTVLIYDPWVFRSPFDVTTADFDGDGLDEMVTVHRQQISGSMAQIVACLFRLEEGEWTFHGDHIFTPWTLGYLQGVFQNDIDHLAVTTGRFRIGSTQPLIAIGAGHRIWRSTGQPDYPTLQIFPSLHLLEVDVSGAEEWQLTERHNIDNLAHTTIFTDSYQSLGPSLGIASGDLNFDGKDEIVLAGPDKLRVYGVSQDLQMVLATEEARRPTWDDASRRTVQVVDLDASPGNFVPEILYQEWMVNNPKADLTPGLTAYWNFDEDFSATAGGSAFDAVPHNDPQIEDSGRYGSSVRIVRNQVQCLEVNTPVVTPGQDHTYSVWCRATWAPGTEDISWYLLQSFPNYTISYYCRNYDGDGLSSRGVVQSQWDSGDFSHRFNNSTFVDRWHNFIVTYDADQALHHAYLDGELVGTLTSSSVLSETSGLIIGGKRDQTNSWDGWIDDVAVWDRVLTSQEIAAVQKQPIIPVERDFQVVIKQPILTPEAVGQDTLWTVTGLQGLDSWQSSAEFGGDVALVVGDFDGDGYRIGNYTHHQGVVATTPTVVLKAPPIHFDVLDGTVYDLAECFPGPCDFLAEYHHTQGSSHTTETEAKTTFGLGASLTVGSEFDWLGAKAETTVKTTYGEHFENSSWGEESVSVEVGVTTWNEDVIHAAVITYDVYEYEVLGEGSVVGNVAVTVPIQGNRTWYSTDGWLQLFNGSQSPSYPLDHEPGNLLSYPDDLGVDEVNDQLNSDTYEVHSSGEYTYSVTYSDVSGSSAGTTREFGIEMGSTVGAGGVELELNASYSSSQMKMFSTEVSEDLQILVNFSYVNNNNARYALRPMLYWSGGTLVLDYEVEPHTTIDQASWWDVHYREPDPAFILTHRYDEERYPAGGDPGVIKYVTPDITLQPPYAAVGDSQTVTAKVRNFSLEDLDQAIEVEFFLGDPDGVWGEGLSIGSGMVGPIPTRGMREVSIDWQVPPGTPEVGRIWAKLNVGDLEEVHTNNNKGYAILQSSSASAVYDPFDLPPLLNIKCSPNPFNPMTNFEFWLPHNGHTTLNIYDVTGRLVAKVVDQYLTEGNYVRTWNGTDSSGRRLASGVYLYRIESGGFANTGKMVMLK